MVGFFVLFCMSGKQFVCRPVHFPSQVPELPGQTVLSLRSDASWKECFGVAGDSVPLACVMVGEEGALALSLAAPRITCLSWCFWLQASVVASDLGALGRVLPAAGHRLSVVPALDVSRDY